MAPTPTIDDYRSFFGACASVAGALVGLLFVAVSVAPHKLAGDRAEIEFQVGAGAALTALLDTLLVALSDLIPGVSPVPIGTVLGAGGCSSVLGLAVVSVTSVGARRSLAALVRLASLLSVVGWQFLAAVVGDPAPTAFVRTSTEVCLLLFVFAVNQAWKLLDARPARLFPVLASLAAARHRATQSRPSDPQPEGAAP